MLETICCVFLVYFLSVVSSEIVDTEFGSVRGWSRKSRDHQTYYGFTGIPYAQPPTGNLRFMNPKPAKHWSGVYDATKMPSPCLQIPFYIKSLRNETIGNEDCLYLNVFTPELKSKMPVMVYIHGGGFRMGTIRPMELADYFMDEDVVLVTPQYRLGALGFLSSEDSTIPGNYGLKDQALALTWVKEQIHHFGGDPKKVTVFGDGAGGISAEFLALSSLSKGLVKGVISQSGAINEIWGIDKRKGRAKDLALKVGRIVGCKKIKNSKDLLKCLQDANEKRIIESEMQMLFWDYEPSTVFKPVIEKDDKGAFITDDPLQMSSRLPWIAGVTTGEGNLIVASLISQDQTTTDEFIQHMDEYIAKMLGEVDITDKVKKSVDRVKKRYFKNTSTLDRVLSALKEFYGDLNYYWPVQKALKKYKGDAYYYVFDYRGGETLSDFFGVKSDIGVNHADECFSLFNRSSISSGKHKQNDKEVSQAMVKIWVDFAKHQKPTMTKPKWSLFETSEYLHITDKLKMDKGFRSDVLEFWESLPIFKKT